ncbi:hypothetical protein BCV72DRAFT_202203 [Rhizopus microsporus var. microsporus]|uniref:Bud22 domain-containing protein n=1 Tax=Rhizopus microsporus var. microsporus TaxID=86635 RepID=A0A1X0RAZ0_RHIZD|nr:hypothetical protein BCV72DRAFT_202203 [Rhizopus microsporus var. microsporus]
MKTAIMAASRAKHQQIHNPNFQPTDTEALKEELQNTRKLKLEHKLIKSAKAMGENDYRNDEKESQKKVKPEDLPKLEKELDMLKHVDLEYLADKKVKSTLQKNTAFKNEELVKQVIDSIEINNKYPEDIDKLILSNIEARLLAHKSVVAEVQSITQSFISILKGDAEKIEKKKAEELEKKKKAEEAKKRAAEANDEGQGAKRQKMNGKPNASSKFTDSLTEYDEKNDEFFKKIYEGETKKNRPGQRQRRKQWEELYGRKANHISEQYKKREEKRLANPDYKPKKKQEKKLEIKKAPAEPMHPSWEAKRQQQEMMSKALSGKVSSNNKIVFDDD